MSDRNPIKRPPPPGQWIGWAAGIIDGEGNIGYVRATYLYVRVNNTDRMMLEKLKALFGGHISNHTEAGPSRDGSVRKNAWRWQINGPDAVDLLRLVEPWLVTKAENARRALQIADVLSEGEHGRSSGSKQAEA